MPKVQRPGFQLHPSLAPIILASWAVSELLPWGPKPPSALRLPQLELGHTGPLAGEFPNSAQAEALGWFLVMLGSQQDGLVAPWPCGLVPETM